MAIIQHAFQDIIKYRKDGFHIIGITGRAGAGKTNYISPIITALATENDIWSAILPLDTFFVLSSEDRAKWLAEGVLEGQQEAARRRDQMTWWDFERLEEVLHQLKCGHPVHLRHVYNRADRGRLTGSIDIIPPKNKPSILTLEGVAIAHLKSVDDLFYIHAPADVRFARLCVRDTYRTTEEMRARFALTEGFENKYFDQHKERIHYWIDNSSQSGGDDDLLIYEGNGIL